MNPTRLHFPAPPRVRAALTAGLAALAATLATSPAAHASHTMESMFQDDSLLVYQPIASVSKTLDTMQALGVDRIRVSVYWRLVAPNAGSSTRPTFSGGGESDPAAYSAASWRRYDQLVRAANDRGIAVNFNIGGPAPDWAAQTPPAHTEKDLSGGVYSPNATDFGQFVRAVATRFSGSYAPPNPNPPPPPPAAAAPLLGIQLSPQQPAATSVPDPPESVLPRVSYWSIWNEPNQPVFLAPQWLGGVEAAPRIYRALLDNAFAALQDTGHGADTILYGETAPKGGFVPLVDGTMRPLTFLRALYCLNRSYAPLRGRRARRYGCPVTGPNASFAAQHPALFHATGYAHHPYSILTPPFIRSRFPDSIGLADLPLLEHTLDRIYRRYGQSRHIPIYITEFGYQTRPPDPFGYTERLAADFINESEFILYSDPRVLTTHQFLLVDAGPLTQFPSTSPSYWSSFQTGLIGLDGRRKLLFNAYRFPLYVVGAQRRSPGSFRVWGDVRAGSYGVAQTVAVQFRARGRHTQFNTVKVVRTTNPRGYLDTRVRLRRSGAVRLTWRNPADGRLVFSRTAAIQIG